MTSIEIRDPQATLKNWGGGEVISTFRLTAGSEPKQKGSLSHQTETWAWTVQGLPMTKALERPKPVDFRFEQVERVQIPSDVRMQHAGRCTCKVPRDL